MRNKSARSLGKTKICNKGIEYGQYQNGNGGSVADVFLVFGSWFFGAEKSGARIGAPFGNN